MSEASSDDADKPMEQPKEDLSKFSGNLSMTTGFSTEMSDTSSDGAKKLMEQLNEDLPEAMGHNLVNTNSSDETSTPPKNLSDMPIDVVGLIIERSDYEQQLKLRKVSKTLRALVDKQIPACKRIRFDCKRESTIVTFQKHTLIYDNHGNELGVENDAETDEEENDDEGIIEGLNEAAFDDLASTLKNPRLQLETLYIDDGFSKKTDFDRNWNRVHSALESLNHQLSVKSFGINVSCGSSIASILRHLKPGVLKRISLGSDWIDGSNEMDQVARLEQWKQAEELELQFFNNRFPMKYATHFKRFVFEEFFIDEDKFIRIRDFLSKLQNFEHCILSCWEFSDDPNSVHRLLGAPVSSNTTEEIFRHSIPDSDDYFEFNWSKGTDDVEIEKKKRESH